MTTLLAGCSPAVDTGTAVKAAPESGRAVVPAVALDGTYTVQYDGTGIKNGVRLGAPDGGIHHSTNVWVFRMACDEKDCRSVGAPLYDVKDPSVPPAQVGVADYVDGRWSLVLQTKDVLSCTGPRGQENTADGWTIWDIEPGPDGTLIPTTTAALADQCALIDVEHPTMTRVADPIPEFPLPDPADQPPRTIPPAAAFHGDYAVTVTPAGGPRPPAAVDHDVQTWCEHTGDRCVTTATSRSAPEAPFADMWIYQFEGDGYRRVDAPGNRPCPDGRAGVTADSETLPLPADTRSDPIRKLTGERTSAFTQTCTGSVVDEVEYALTSD